MNIDVTKICEDYLKNLTDKEKEFARLVGKYKEYCYQKAREEIDAVIKKYAQMEAAHIVTLYDILLRDKSQTREEARELSEFLRSIGITQEE